MKRLNLFFLLLLFTSAVHAQSINEIIETLDIDTLMNHGNKDNRINMAFANVGHATASRYTDQEDFIEDVEKIIDRFDTDSDLGKSGFSHYRNFFNLYSVWFPEPVTFEPIPSYYQFTQGIIDSLFLPWANDRHGWVTMIYTLKNGSGGGAGRDLDIRRGDALIWGLDWETVLHEFNHTMPSVSDEYSASGEWSNFVCNPTANQTPNVVKDEISWRNWIDDDTPIPTPYAEEYFGKIGAFEGTISGYFGCHRPTAQNCYMGAGGFGEGFGDDMCSVCLQRFICRTYFYVDALENKLPAQQDLTVGNGETMTFSVDPIVPIPNTQKYEWYLNGKKISEGETAIDITFQQCTDNEVTFVLTDTTEFVRFDEKFKDVYPEPKQSYTWYVNNLEPAQYDFDAVVTTSPADCTGLENGSITIETIGGQAPFSYILNGTDYGETLGPLAPGQYALSIVDAIGCGINRQVEIMQEDQLDFELVTSFDHGVWTLSPRFSLGTSTSDFSYTWSDGKSSMINTTTIPGSHILTITNNSGCSVSREINISPPCEQMKVTSKVHLPNELAGGSIHLKIEDGIGPYNINWYKNTGIDLTLPDADLVISSPNQIEVHPHEYLFDDVQLNYDFWAENFTGQNYAGYDFGTPTVIDFYTIMSNFDVPGRDAKNWFLQGSNDLVNWTNLDQQTGITFTERWQTIEFSLDEPAEYRAYRIQITANHGDGWLAIQEMEFGLSNIQEEMAQYRNLEAATELNPGEYSYEVFDKNNNNASENISLPWALVSDNVGIEVEQKDEDEVRIKTPLTDREYYWFDDEKALNLLHIGEDFQPPSAGNYYVKASSSVDQTFGAVSKGFAITMQNAPEISGADGSYVVENPDPETEYVWFDRLVGGNVLHVGSSYELIGADKVYVSAYKQLEVKPIVHPDSIFGQTFWADASDLNGDDILDINRETSAAYDWKFRRGGQWDPTGFFAFRGNYSNGLGVVDLATVWFQYIQGANYGVRTIVMAYEENGFSREGSAPFYGFKDLIGRHEDNSQIYSDNIGSITTNGRTHINGVEVNPMETENSYEMKTFSLVLTNLQSINNTACDEYWEGKIGEILTYSKALTTEEIEGLHEYLRKKWISTADLASPRTEVYWEVIQEPIAFEEEITICEGQDYYGLTEEGIYIRQLKTAAGIDSTVTTNLMVLPMIEAVTISQVSNTLSTSYDAVTYQWYLDGEAIPEATEASWTAVIDGLYQLVITNVDGCESISNEINVTTTSVEEEIFNKLLFFPNPTSGELTIHLPKYHEVQCTIYDAQGRIMDTKQLTNTYTQWDISSFGQGVYSLVLQSNHSQAVRQVVVIK